MFRPGLNRRTIAIATMLISTSMIALSLSVTATPEGQAGVPVTTPLLAQILGLITDDDSFATADLSTLLPPDPPATPPPTQHYGPYESTSPDSGTCGNDWAQDHFDRHFTVFNKGGSLVVVEQFKDGSFVTNLGPSPGACQNPQIAGGTVNAGVTGKMHGYLVIPIPSPSTQTSDDPSCVAGSPSAPCTTTGFINSHFSCVYGATCVVTTFFFHYTASDQDLIMHEWKNASDDRGGNHGDIRSTDT
jgi:hypothetical protein